MPLTRTQGEATLKYVVVEVLNQPDDGPLMKSVMNELIDHARDLTSLQKHDIGDLKYLQLMGIFPLSDPVIAECCEPSVTSLGYPSRVR
jgi:hypothetical protein